MNIALQKDFAIDLIVFFLGRNDYKILKGKDACALSGGDIYVPEEQFSINVHWVEDDNAALALSQVLPNGQYTRGIRQYNAVVVGKGYSIYLCDELDHQLLYDEERYSVKSANI